MLNFEFNTISPLDGRYYKDTFILRDIFSEYALIKNRIKIEINWFIKLSHSSKIKNLPQFSQDTYLFIQNIYNNFNKDEAIIIKKIEQKTQHDIKAVEYYIKSKFILNDQLKPFIEFVHFGCTSDDINNLSYALMLKKAKNKILIPLWKKVILCFKKLSLKYKNITILSRTHGQPATPSTIGKEFCNFYYRLKRKLKIFNTIKILGKFNGSTGNYNALFLAYPNIQWRNFNKDFVESFGITWNPCTTQIEPHDYITEYLFCLTSFNSILIDFNRDIWGYISMKYFFQNKTSEEVGSSIMPHKINPIHFENSEGNLGISNALNNYMSIQLPLSRWQRDLTDSTLLRNIGVTIGHSLIGYNSLLKGIHRIDVSEKVIYKDLSENWEILCEAIQTIMRKHGIHNAYEQLKKLSDQKQINQIIIKKFIDTLNIPQTEKDKLYFITPHNYSGLASEIVDNV
ncbi:adenylosuccinate lyase [Buchnera aphidicola (Thelaxes californica)]|uniref:Adenylosuccinate lyase n=1 Tax=Buchnera aphidicola (Thelaxes californica) TaxID=1315998 RepID=A0A4D6YM11_9GAMM|nr:adenylosuccinate lyase [Buchnera aphidicola]QCI26738.1 adenylosuccinate lyase [Buchnera aphidicola (Thelaxes californica)]